jgi:hypothetical protein
MKQIFKSDWLEVDRSQREPLWRRVLHRYTNTTRFERDDFFERPAHTVYFVGRWRITVRDKGERFPLK